MLTNVYLVTFLQSYFKQKTEKVQYSDLSLIQSTYCDHCRLIL